MKSNSLTVSTSPNWELVTITIRNPFTWKNLATFYHRILPSFLEFKNVTIQDAKLITQGILFIACCGVFTCYCLPFLLYVFQ